MLTAGILEVSNGTFQACTAVGKGGAAHLASAELSFEHATFAGNTAGFGSAIYFQSRGVTTMETNIRSASFVNNTGRALFFKVPTTWQCRFGLTPNPSSTPHPHP